MPEYWENNINKPEDGYYMLLSTVVYQACRDMLSMLKLQYQGRTTAELDRLKINQGQDAEQFLRSPERLAKFTRLDSQTLIDGVYCSFAKYINKQIKKGSCNNEE